MNVKCERCGAVWDATPHPYPSSLNPWSKERCEEEGFAFPARSIDCPRCARGYFQEEDGSWVSDRPLTILEE